MIRKFRDFDEYLIKKLKNKKYAQAYLEETFKEEDKRLFLDALMLVFVAQGGDIESLSEKTNISRTNIYRMLSTRGNPRWEKLAPIFDAMNLKIHFSFEK